jgi:hypothetical protein
MLSIKEIYKIDSYEKYNFIAFALFPNNVDIFTINNIPFDFITKYINQFKIFIFPVYKNYWKNVHICFENNKFFLGNNNIISIEFYSKYTNKIKIFKNDYIYIEDVDIIITYEVYAYFNIYIKNKFIINNLSLHEVFGIVESATKNNMITTSDNIIKNYKLTKSNNKYDKVPLKSLYPAIQLYCFHTWINNFDITVSGGTGIGKTSQIPKIFLHFNTFFDGYLAFDLLSEYRQNMFLNFKFDRGITFKNCILSMPRKTIMKSTALSMAKSLNMELINSSISLKYKDIQNEINYYNPMTNRLSCYLMIVVNRLTITLLNNNNKINSLIIDEIHEHDQFADICIAVSHTLKKNFGIKNIILMSATLDYDKINIDKFFNNKINHLYIKGDRLFEVNVNNTYINTKLEIYKIIDDINPIIGTTVIIFKESVSAIMAEYKKIFEYFKQKKFVKIYILHGKILNSNEIIKEIESSKKYMNIILSTNFLESSITITNAICVIDNGKMFLKKFLSGNIVYITDSMAEQRKGRLGRVRPGTYIPLYEQSKLQKNFKNINYQYLYNYLIIFKYFNMDIYKDFYILPDDMTRIDRTVKYLLSKNININTNILKIYKIFFTYECNMIEYIPLYMSFGTNKILLAELIKLDMGISQSISYELKKKLINLHVNCKVLKSIKNKTQKYTIILKIINSPEINDIFKISKTYFSKLDYNLICINPIIIV